VTSNGLLIGPPVQPTPSVLGRPIPLIGSPRDDPASQLAGMSMVAEARAAALIPRQLVGTGSGHSSQENVPAVFLKIDKQLSALIAGPDLRVARALPRSAIGRSSKQPPPATRAERSGTTEIRLSTATVATCLATQAVATCYPIATAPRSKPRKSAVFRSRPFAVLRSTLPCSSVLFAAMRCDSY
jgi:hypothetical protein